MSISKVFTNNIITPPKHLRSNEILQFLNDCQKIFEIKGREEKNFILDLTKVKKANVLGILLIYKIIEYSVNHSCFDRPLIRLEAHSEVGILLEKFGFTGLILAYIQDPGDIEKQYRSLKISVEENFIIAAQALMREDKKSKEEINKKYLPQIEKYYKDSPKAISMILLVFSEILLNFWEHAIDDTKSIIVANGNKNNIEIACADTGNGIISTLGRSLNYSDLRPEEILLKSLERGITSKQLTNHMGYGLWILDQVATLTKGRLHLYSEGAYYHNEGGSRKSGKCGYWQGSIIYISLPLLKPKSLEDIEGNSSLNLKINWI